MLPYSVDKVKREENVSRMKDLTITEKVVSHQLAQNILREREDRGKNLDDIYILNIPRPWN